LAFPGILPWDGQMLIPPAASNRPHDNYRHYALYFTIFYVDTGFHRVSAGTDVVLKYIRFYEAIKNIS
jgi:hypothetical protein